MNSDDDIEEDDPTDLFDTDNEPPDNFIDESETDALAISADGKKWVTLLPFTEAGGVGDIARMFNFKLSDILSKLGNPGHGRVWFRWQQKDVIFIPWCGTALDNIQISTL